MLPQRRHNAERLERKWHLISSIFNQILIFPLSIVSGLIYFLFTRELRNVANRLWNCNSVIIVRRSSKKFYEIEKENLNMSKSKFRSIIMSLVTPSSTFPLSVSFSRVSLSSDELWISKFRVQMEGEEKLDSYWRPHNRKSYIYLSLLNITNHRQIDWTRWGTHQIYCQRNAH